MLVAANKQLYITLPKRQKMLLSRSIVNAVRSQNPPGRFLQKDGKTKLWFDVGDQRAQEKTSQALREGAPDIRKKVAAAKSSATNSETKSATGTPAAPTLGEVSKSGAKNDLGNTSEIPVHSGKPESATSSEVLHRTSESSGGMISPPNPQHFNMQQHQQNVNAYGGHDGSGHMTLNERGVAIQNAMMNGARNLNDQNHLHGNNNDAQSMYRFQQLQQQQSHLQQQYQQQQDYQQQQQYQYQQQQQHQNNNVNYQQQRQQHFQQDQQQGYYENNDNSIRPYDDFGASPPGALERDGLSFGSLHMTDAEMHKLQQGSTHTTNKHLSNRRHSISKEQPQYQGRISTNTASSNSDDNNGAAFPAAPMGGVLEPTGISIGDISMMSANTNFQMKLEETGASFGTMMSYNTFATHGNNPDMVDGGLMDAVGTSFGSLSLDKNNRDMLFKTLEIAGGGAEVPPMFQSETKASSNLLDCSDTESESSREKEQLTKQKSQAWEMMKTQLEKQTSKGASVGSQDLMPPPVGVPQQNANKNHNAGSPAATFDNLEINLPPTTMESNFSALSAWSAADNELYDSNSDMKRETGNPTETNRGGDEGFDDVVAVPPPPPQLTKTDSF